MPTTTSVPLPGLPSPPRSPRGSMFSTIQLSELDITLGRSARNVPFPIGLGYTGDGRHVVTSTDGNEFQLGDEICHLYSLDVTHISHSDLLIMVRSALSIEVTIRRYPPDHPKARYEIVARTTLLGLSTQDKEKRLANQQESAMRIASPELGSLPGAPQTEDTTQVRPQIRKTTTVVGSSDEEDDGIPTIPSLPNAHVGPSDPKQKLKQKRRTSQNLDKRLLSIGTPTNFVHKSHMTKMDAERTVLNGQSTKAVPDIPTLEGKILGKNKMFRRQSQALSPRMATLTIGAPKDFRHTEHVSKDDVKAMTGPKGVWGSHADVNPSVVKEDTPSSAPTSVISHNEEIEDLKAMNEQLRSQLDVLESAATEGTVTMAMQYNTELLEQKAERLAEATTNRTSVTATDTPEVQHEISAAETIQSPSGDTSTAKIAFINGKLQATFNQQQSSSQEYEIELEDELEDETGELTSELEWAANATKMLTMNEIAAKKLNEAAAFLSSDPGAVKDTEVKKSKTVIQMMIVINDYIPAQMSAYQDTEDELTMKRGELVKVFGERGEDGYFVGEINGVRGLVPASFLSKAPEQTENFIATTSSSGRNVVQQGHQGQVLARKVVAINDYNPLTMSPFGAANDELELTKGQELTIHGEPGTDGYYVGQVGEKWGLVPASAIFEQTPESTNTGSAISLSSSSRSTSEPNKATSKIELVALYSYKGRNKNELSFQKGDKFWVLKESSPSWYKVHTADKKVGYVPSNYVRII